MLKQNRKQTLINYFTDFNEFIKVIENNNIDDIILDFNFDSNIEDKTKCIEAYNQILNYLIANGKKYEYLTFDDNRLTYSQFIQFSKRIDKICSGVNKKEPENDIETARVIENELVKYIEPVYDSEPDYYLAPKRNILKVLTDKRASCTHFGILYQYLCIREGIPCLIRDNQFQVGEIKEGHYFNLAFLGEEKTPYYIDTLFDYNQLLGRYETSFSFTSYETLQKLDEEIYGLECHKLESLDDKDHAAQDYTGLKDIDKKFGYISKRVGMYLDAALVSSLEYILKEDKEPNVFDRADMFMSMFSHYPDLKYLSQKSLQRHAKPLLNEYLQVKKMEDLYEGIKYEQFPNMEFIKCKLNKSNNVVVKIAKTNPETNEEKSIYYFILPEKKGEIKYMNEEEWQESIESKKVELEDETKDNDILK